MAHTSLEKMSIMDVPQLSIYVNASCNEYTFGSYSMEIHWLQRLVFWLKTMETFNIIELI